MCIKIVIPVVELSVKLSCPFCLYCIKEKETATRCLRILEDFAHPGEKVASYTGITDASKKKKISCERKRWKKWHIHCNIKGLKQVAVGHGNSPVVRADLPKLTKKL